jgi:cytochrome c553
MTDIAKALDDRLSRMWPPIMQAATQSESMTLANLHPQSCNWWNWAIRAVHPPCASCHRAGAGGPIEAPVLAEQRENTSPSNSLYASGERNDVYARMCRIASRLTEGEVKGLAGYYRAGFK